MDATVQHRRADTVAILTQAAVNVNSYIFIFLFNEVLDMLYNSVVAIGNHVELESVFQELHVLELGNNRLELILLEANLSDQVLIFYECFFDSHFRTLR